LHRENGRGLDDGRGVDDADGVADLATLLRAGCARNDNGVEVRGRAHEGDGNVSLANARRHALAAIPDASHLERHGRSCEAGDSEGARRVGLRALLTAAHGDLRRIHRFVRSGDTHATGDRVVLRAGRAGRRGNRHCDEQRDRGGTEH
jgi:hypothetical protein